jgi:O-antigen/teichoic acid export membrane protein
MSSFVLTVATALVQSGDLVLLRSYAAPDEVGQYAAAASIGGLVFALCAPIYMPAFPKTVAAHAGGKPTWPILREVLLVVGAIGICMIAGSALLGASAAEAMFGPAYGGVGTYLPAYISKIVGLVVLGTIGQYALGVGITRPAYYAAAVALSGPLCIALLQPAPLEATLIMLGATCAATALLSILLYKTR